MGTFLRYLLANIRVPILKGPGGNRDIITCAKIINGVPNVISVTIFGSPITENIDGHKPYKNFCIGVAVFPHFSSIEVGTTYNAETNMFIINNDTPPITIADTPTLNTGVFVNKFINTLPIKLNKRAIGPATKCIAALLLAILDVVEPINTIYVI